MVQNLTQKTHQRGPTVFEQPPFAATAAMAIVWSSCRSAARLCYRLAPVRHRVHQNHCSPPVDVMGCAVRLLGVKYQGTWESIIEPEGHGFNTAQQGHDPGLTQRSVVWK